MKLPQVVLFALISISVISVKADIKPIQPDSEEANVADGIFSVTNLELGKYAYKIVAMDSKLNGDTSVTTILLVGEGSVGGEAGYDVAFQLTPSENGYALDSASIEKGEIALTFRIDGGRIKKFVHYDATSGTLKERLGK